MDEEEMILRSMLAATQNFYAKKSQAPVRKNNSLPPVERRQEKTVSIIIRNAYGV